MCYWLLDTSVLAFDSLRLKQMFSFFPQHQTLYRVTPKSSGTQSELYSC